MGSSADKKTCEELVELQVEILHHDPLDVLKSEDVYKDVMTEVTDVYIMLEQVVKMYGIKKSDIDKEMTYKLKRANDKIMKGERGCIAGLGKVVTD